MDLFCKQNVIHGDCLEIMRGTQANSIDCILTDPPYGLSFMGKHWDKGIPDKVFWAEALRVCKPGAMMLAFGGTRTYHRLACAIEDAGWEIRDCLMWLYGSGFPKSMDVSKAIDKNKGLEREIIGVKPGHEGFENNRSHSLNDGWQRPWTRDPEKVKLYHSQTIPFSDMAKTFSGYGTALKPAYEPIVMAMKPLDGTFAQNAEKWEVAGINIDASRIATYEIITNHSRSSISSVSKGIYGDSASQETHQTVGQKLGRWPSNLLLDEESAAMLDEQSEIIKSGKNGWNQTKKDSGMWRNKKRINHLVHNDSGGASRFFYCAKASPSERGEFNKHPTVKPTKLLEYLLKLIIPPHQDVIVLDPFCGSGSTLVAAKNLGFNAVGIEIEEEYCNISRRRLE